MSLFNKEKEDFGTISSPRATATPRPSGKKRSMSFSPFSHVALGTRFKTRIQKEQQHPERTFVSDNLDDQDLQTLYLEDSAEEDV